MAWLLKRFFVPFLLLWLVFLAIISVGMTNRSPQSPEAYFLGTSLLLLPFFAWLFPIALYGFYQSKMREAYHSVTWFTGEKCPVCGQSVPQLKITASLFQLPNMFRMLVHYQSAHEKIASNAKSARRVLVLFVHEVVAGISILVGVSFFGQAVYVWHNTFALALVYSSTALILVWLISWAIIWAKLSSRKC